jgi:hypothetical protein
MIKNKKGALTDSIFVPAYLVLIVATIFIGLYVWFAFSSGMADVVANTPQNETVISAMDNINIGMSSFDYMFPIMVVGLLITSLIFAYKTGAGVIYAVLSLILWGVALIMSWVYTVTFEQFVSSFPTIAASTPIIFYIMSNIKWLVLGWLFLISIVMFTRNKQEEQQLSAAEVAFMR